MQPVGWIIPGARGFAARKIPKGLLVDWGSIPHASTSNTNETGD